MIVVSATDPALVTLLDLAAEHYGLSEAWYGTAFERSLYDRLEMCLLDTLEEEGIDLAHPDAADIARRIGEEMARGDEDDASDWD